MLTKRQRGRIEKFVAALRSGKYKQGRDFLTDGKTFCCLGVACDVAARSLKTNWDLYSFLGSADTLPDKVKDYYGFPDNDPMLYTLKGGKRDLATALNDRHHYSFKRIAKCFERTYLKSK